MPVFLLRIILFGKQSDIHTNETRKPWDQHRKKSSHPSLFCLLSLKLGEGEIPLLQGEMNSAGRPNHRDYLSPFVQSCDSMQTGCSAKWPPPPRPPPSQAPGPCQKTFSLLGLSALLTGSLSLPHTTLPAPRLALPPLLQLRWACWGSTEHTDVDVPQRKLYPHPLVIVILQPHEQQWQPRVNTNMTWKQRKAQQTNKQTNTSIAGASTSSVPVPHWDCWYYIL